MEQDQLESIINALTKINISLENLTEAVHQLGVNHADTNKGAIELLIETIKEKEL